MSDLTSLIRDARAAVVEAGLDPETPSGVAAFQVAFAHLSDPGARSSSISDAGKTRTGVPDQSEGADALPVSRAARWIGVNEAALSDGFSFNQEGVDIELHSRFLPLKKSARQRMLALLKLAVDRVAYSREEVPARELNAICQRYDCLDQNLPSNLDKYENYVIRRGKRGAFTYRINQFGVDAAREELRRLLDAPSD